jgi:hypothetical protein
LGVAGAGWTAVTGDPIGAILGAGAVGTRLVAGNDSSQVDAYGYLFMARKELL